MVLAGIAALRPDPAGDDVEVLVADHDLSSGTALTAADVRLEKRLRTTVPAGALADPGNVIGSTLAGPTRRGEILTDVRLLRSRLAESTAGPGARIVPLHLADDALIDLLRVGDVVDVLAATAHDSQPESRVLATDAIVILVSAHRELPAADNGRVVLVALPNRVATTVAVAALGQTVTVVLH